MYQMLVLPSRMQFSTLRMNRNWQSATTVRIFVPVEDSLFAALERRRWIHFLQMLRIPAQLEIINLRDECASILGYHPSSINTSTTLSHSIQQEEFPDPVENPCLGAHSFIFTELDEVKRLQVIFFLY